MSRIGILIAFLSSWALAVAHEHTQPITIYIDGEEVFGGEVTIYIKTPLPEGTQPLPDKFSSPSVSWEHTGGVDPVTIEVTDSAGIFNWSTILQTHMGCGSEGLNPERYWRLCGTQGTAWINPTHAGENITGWWYWRWCQGSYCSNWTGKVFF